MKTSWTTLATAALLLVFSLGAWADDDYSQAELNQMLAPVALYPDTVLSHILIASTYPLEVVQANRWAQRHRNMEGAAAVSAAEREGWDPSVTALVAFPDILERMADDLEWTQDLGEAFLWDEGEVLASVQDLRQRAYEAGTLRTTEHQEVVIEQKTIIVEPRVSEVIYIPYYDTRVVYGPWRWHHHPPHRWHRPSRGYWNAGIFWSFGTRIDHHSFYFSSFHWHNRHTVVIDIDLHNHHRFHSGRSVVRYKEARRWKHNPSHRRGVEYRRSTVRQQYAAPSRTARHSGTRVERAQRVERIEQRLQTPRSSARSEPRRSRDAQARNDRQQPRLDRTERRSDTYQTRRETPSRMEQRSGERLRANEPNRDRAQVQRQAREERTRTTRTERPSREERANARNLRQPERSQQNFQRSTRDRVDAARNRSSISERARQSRNENGRAERR